MRNGGAALEACLASIAAQRGIAWRLIAVDDGSTDDTPARLRAFARTHPATRLLDNRGAGLVAALNLGLAHSTAPLVARMDADDTMHPDRLRLQADALAADPTLGLISCRVATDTLPPGLAHYLAWSNTLLTPDAIAGARFIESPLVHPTVCFRRSLMDHHGGYRDGPFPEDYELWLRWLEAGVHMAKLDAELLRWNDTPGRLTRTDPRYDVAAFFAIKAGYLARWLDRHSPHRCRVWIWGAGYQTRRRLRTLAEHGITIEGFIDIDPRKIGRRNRDGLVHAPEALPPPGHAFVLAAVRTRDARTAIATTLATRGYHEGLHWLPIA